MRRVQKIMDGLKIRAKDIKLLLSKLNVSKNMGPDEIRGAYDKFQDYFRMSI